MATYYSTIADKMLVDKPRTVVNPAEHTGKLVSYGATFTLTTDHDDGDVVIMCPIPSNMAIRELLLSSDGGATAGVLDIAVYTLSTADGTNTFTNANADLFASAQAIASAINRTDVLGESGEVLINERYQPLWQVVGATSDPGGVYYLGFEIETADVDADTVVAIEAIGVI